jgi:glyoxylase-like metal-dependent hydrolase (beta-lactamase superfamily II)
VVARNQAAGRGRLTHTHHDHLDGLHSVLANFKVGELWIGKDEETPAFLSLLAEARACAGTRFQLGPSNGQGAVAGGCVGCIEGIERRFRW